MQSDHLQAPSPNILLEAVHLAENTGEDVVHTLESVFEFLIGSAENFTTNIPEDISKLGARPPTFYFDRQSPAGPAEWLWEYLKYPSIACQAFDWRESRDCTLG